MHVSTQRISTTYLALLLSAPIATGLISGCAGRVAKQQQEDQQEAAQKTQSALHAPVESVEIPRETTLGINARVSALEAKISAMNDKLDATRAALDGFLAAHAPKPTGLPSQASETVGTALSVKPLAGDAESGFVNNEAIQLYRKAEILQESQKFSDAILVFVTFLERYPDHPLAGSAQFHVGEAYFRQGQWRRAEQELQKVLTSYDRSIQVSQTLRLMAEAETHLGKPDESARHRQQLTSLFANSPAAAKAESAPAVAPAVAPAQEPTGKPALDGPPPTAPMAAPRE